MTNSILHGRLDIHLTVVFNVVYFKKNKSNTNLILQGLALSRKWVQNTLYAWWA
jgi:hypothetical protein